MPVSMLNTWNTLYGRNIHDRAWMNRYRYNMSRFPVVGDFIRAEDSMRYWNDYFRNRPGAGGWASVKYPSMMAGAGGLTSSVGHSAVGFVSKNLPKLYDGKDTGRWVPKPEDRYPIRTNIGPIRGKFRFYGY